MSVVQRSYFDIDEEVLVGHGTLEERRPSKWSLLASEQSEAPTMILLDMVEGPQAVEVAASQLVQEQRYSHAYWALGFVVDGARRGGSLGSVEIGHERWNMVPVRQVVPQSRRSGANLLDSSTHFERSVLQSPSQKY